MARAKTKLTLYHGSDKVVGQPVYGAGAAANDYGRGFYCTENEELSKEWACRSPDGGFSNRYALSLSGLSVMRLEPPEYGILDWLALLANNRTFTVSSDMARRGMAYLAGHFLPDTSNADIIIGYRADDSYFSFATDFLQNTISLSKLERAMRLGKLGEQVALISGKAFSVLRFERAHAVDGGIYYAKRRARDEAARADYLSGIRREDEPADDIYLIDILREGMVRGDARLR
jgi:hypothetical protein